ncbi:ABC transporter ATP-binding protein [Clostridium sp. DJ247]|uniref:ABC transporter ATP-binding protein n=1 Tax=Clostridium sp. DJ247 TaxID=2726188 RepID=UPI00162AEF6D|nr:ABC transporter ATP-binding protein [Clostridium sp. DJ247]MBC2582339.1 ABC transporter ATP-binding protein [Clostridium sp. DJ247]
MENEKFVDYGKTIIALNNVNLIYKAGNKQVNALENINLDIEEGEFVCILGPSGCGKSTLLKIIAGFISPTYGEVTMNGDTISGADWHRGVVFQQPALYPWLNVEDNVKFGLKMRKIPKAERIKATEYYLNKVGLLEFRKYKPYELSGGMKQRISIARVLVNNPLVLLMDEPFGALDALTREQMQNLLRDIWRETKKTILFITHDVDEALSLGTRVLVMSSRPGRIIKEFKTSFTEDVVDYNSSEVRFTEGFKLLREQVLDLINNVRTK